MKEIKRYDVPRRLHGPADTIRVGMNASLNPTTWVLVLPSVPFPPEKYDDVNRKKSWLG